jgi:hypothetical protein
MYICMYAPYGWSCLSTTLSDTATTEYPPSPPQVPTHKHHVVAPQLICQGLYISCVSLTLMSHHIHTKIIHNKTTQHILILDTDGLRTQDAHWGRRHRLFVCERQGSFKPVRLISLVSILCVHARLLSGCLFTHILAFFPLSLPATRRRPAPCPWRSS